MHRSNGWTHGTVTGYQYGCRDSRGPLCPVSPTCAEVASADREARYVPHPRPAGWATRTNCPGLTDPEARRVRDRGYSRKYASAHSEVRRGISARSQVAQRAKLRATPAWQFNRLFRAVSRAARLQTRAHARALPGNWETRYGWGQGVAHLPRPIHSCLGCDAVFIERDHEHPVPAPWKCKVTARLYAAFNGRCVWGGEVIDWDLPWRTDAWNPDYKTTEHIVPRSVSHELANAPDNLALSCLRHNMERGLGCFG
jgi:hypothetical protein